MKTFKFLQWSFLGTRRVPMTLTEGVVDQAASVVFNHGQCHSMALALFHETGWPIVGFQDENDTHDSPGHCAVYCEALDECVDVDGIGAHARYEARCARAGLGVKVRAIKPSKMRKLRDYLPIKARKARPFAKAVVQQIIDKHGITVLQK